MVLLLGKENHGRRADGHEGYLWVVCQPWGTVPNKVLLQAGFPGQGEPLEFLFLSEGED